MTLFLNSRTFERKTSVYGQLIRAYRIEQKMTLSEYAGRLGIPVVDLSKVESARNLPSEVFHELVLGLLDNDTKLSAELRVAYEMGEKGISTQTQSFNDILHLADLIGAVHHNHPHSLPEHLLKKI